MNGFIGGWIIMSIIAASMSTADGAIVAMGTVLSHNLLRKFGGIFNSEWNLLLMARWCTLLWAIVACIIASTRPNETGYFLLVAFDVCLAGGVVPLFAAVYWKPGACFGLIKHKCKPIAAVCALLSGSILRAILEWSLPKDGLLLLTGKYARSFGPQVAADPEMFDSSVMNGGIAEVCPQEKLEDWTGVDSLLAPVVSLLVLLIVQLLIPNPDHPWLQPESETIETSAEPEDDAAEEAKQVVGVAI